jgi:hypothetical protein
VARHGQLEAAAERHTVNGHHHRLRAIFDLPQQRQQAGSAILLPRGYLAEFLDVRAGDECASTADHYRSVDTPVLDDFLDRVRNTFGYAGTYCVHRGIVDGDDRDVLIFRELNQIAHGKVTLL